MKNKQSDILKFTDATLIVEGIENYELREYEPAAITNPKRPGEICINIEDQDLFSHSSESYLLFQDRLTKGDETAYANADEVAIAKNGLMHLLNEIRITYRIKESKRYFILGKPRRF